MAKYSDIELGAPIALSAVQVPPSLENHYYNIYMLSLLLFLAGLSFILSIKAQYLKADQS